MAYGIGGLTPAEFGDLTPADLNAYIAARLAWQKEQVKMENERIGLIASILQNGIPTISVQKSMNKRKPSDYFKPAVPDTDAKTPTLKDRAQGIYDTMMLWAGATGGRR